MRLARSGDISENPGPKYSLRCFLQNVRSLKAAVADGDSFEYKSTLLRDIAYGYDLDVICLTETWLNDSISDSELLPTAYNVFRKDRKSRGGETLIAVKSNLPTRELEIATTLECVAVEIYLSPEKTLLLINCYRPPSDQEFFHDFKDVIANFRLDKYWRYVWVISTTQVLIGLMAQDLLIPPPAKNSNLQTLLWIIISINLSINLQESIIF